MLLSLALIFLCGLALGGIFRKLHLPQLLGMLLTGILLGPYVLNLLDSSILGISADLRQIALIIIPVSYTHLFLIWRAEALPTCRERRSP